MQRFTSFINPYFIHDRTQNIKFLNSKLFVSLEIDGSATKVGMRTCLSVCSIPKDQTSNIYFPHRPLHTHLSKLLELLISSAENEILSLQFYIKKHYSGTVFFFFLQNLVSRLVVDSLEARAADFILSTVIIYLRLFAFPDCCSWKLSSAFSWSGSKISRAHSSVTEGADPSHSAVCETFPQLLMSMQCTDKIIIYQFFIQYFA